MSHLHSAVCTAPYARNGSYTHECAYMSLPQQACKCGNKTRTSPMCFKCIQKSPPKKMLVPIKNISKEHCITVHDYSKFFTPVFDDVIFKGTNELLDEVMFAGCVTPFPSTLKKSEEGIYTCELKRIGSLILSMECSKNLKDGDIVVIDMNCHNHMSYFQYKFGKLIQHIDADGFGYVLVD